MEKSRDENLRAWALVVGVLIILGVGTFILVASIRDAVRQTQQEAMQPVNQIGTEVAQLFRPTPTVIVDPITIIHQVRSLARLETIQYTVQKVITAETGGGTFGFLFRDRLLLIAHGVVIAGIDLAKLSPGDLRVDDNVLYVRLPEPEIFISTLDNEKSYIYDRDQGILTRGDINLETTARRVAEREIRDVAIEDGILEIARNNAENYLYRLLREIGGYSEVIFEQPDQ